MKACFYPTIVSRKLIALLVALLGFGVVSPGVFAGAAIWSTTNVQFLYGNDYNTGLGGDKTRSILTVEHVNGWKYGDNFFFLDITNPNRTGTNTQTSLYAEFSPRFSLGAMTGKDLSVGIIKDFLITTTLEAGNGFHNYLYGVAADLNLPGFKVFQFNWYIVRDEKTADDKGSQITLVWLYPFSIGGADLTFEGFADYAYGLENSKSNLITAPRLLIDVGKYFNTPGTLQAGIEYQIWRNQFGVDGQSENVPQLMAKWIW
jgi:nucleoside-specific outer membrane channel protein Tsx